VELKCGLRRYYHGLKNLQNTTDWENLQGALPSKFATVPSNGSYLLQLLILQFLLGHLDRHGHMETGRSVNVAETSTCHSINDWQNQRKPKYMD